MKLSIQTSSPLIDARSFERSLEYGLVKQSGYFHICFEQISLPLASVPNRNEKEGIGRRSSSAVRRFVNNKIPSIYRACTCNSQMHTHLYRVTLHVNLNLRDRYKEGK